MAIEKYVQGKDLKKLIDDKMINVYGLRQVLQKKGIMPIFVSQESLSELIYRIFFGSDTMTQIHNIMCVEQNNLKSTMAIIRPQEGVSASSFFVELCDEFTNLRRIPNTEYKLNNIHNNGDSVSLQYEYEKPQKGRIILADSKPVTLDIAITPIDDNQYKVNIRHEGASESKQFVSLLEKMGAVEPSQQVFRLKRITLQSLTKSHKVDFFDKFGLFNFENWNISDITNVTVNKSDRAIDEEDEDQELTENEPTGKLTGISSAILSGAGLRNNDFVKDCMSQGFIFSSMRFKFTHRSLPEVLEIDVNFKNTDLKINIAKTYITEDDGKAVVAQLPPSEQGEYIDYFQNVAFGVYSDLINKQGAAVVDRI